MSLNFCSNDSKSLEGYLASLDTESSGKYLFDHGDLYESPSRLYSHFRNSLPLVVSTSLSIESFSLKKLNLTKWLIYLLDDFILEVLIVN